ncbi:unnamed protein product [Microthlaspi erraticum]|uniref:Uncharacterized protein n=1 Tax=Microthlaspi erraticum TaxID=1685480 RepID=A0A6D2IYA0_9BRAS|nr:unnamed protein product [Microthlaspi erraticum]
MIQDDLLHLLIRLPKGIITTTSRFFVTEHSLDRAAAHIYTILRLCKCPQSFCLFCLRVNNLCGVLRLPSFEVSNLLFLGGEVFSQSSQLSSSGVSLSLSEDATVLFYTE